MIPGYKEPQKVEVLHKCLIGWALFSTPRGNDQVHQAVNLKREIHVQSFSQMTGNDKLLRWEISGARVVRHDFWVSRFLPMRKILDQMTAQP